VNAWLTKDDVPARAEFVITLPNDEGWLADFLGAFLLLAEVDNWEVLGGLSAEEMAAEWLALFLIFAEGREFAMPVGVIVPFGGSVVPNGWLLCDGQEISRVTYADLFGVIGVVYGAGNGTTTFRVPELRTRAPFGFYSENARFDVLGESGGATTHNLLLSEVPPHTHVQNQHTHVQNQHTHVQNQHTHVQNAHQHTVFGLALATGPGSRVTLTSASQADNELTAAATPTNQNTTPTNQNTTPTNQNTTPTNQNEGGGLSHENMPPYLVVNYIIKF